MAETSNLDLVRAFQAIVDTRRSIRIFDGSPVPETVIHSCLDLALLAPNSSNLQPWEFYWVRSPEKKNALVRACLSQAAARTAGDLIVCVARTRAWRRTCSDMIEQMQRHEKAGTRIPTAAKVYYNKLVPVAYSQGWLNIWGYLKKIAVFLYGLRKPAQREPTSHHHMQLWAVKSTALACENLMLAFRAYGYDTCPMEGMDSWRVHRLLNLPSDALVVMVLGIGRRKPEGVTLPRIRADRAWFVKEV